MSLRKTPLSRALNRPNLIAGGERKLVLLAALICFALIFSALNWFTAIAAIVIWFGSIAALRQMAKADPQMSEIYLRSIKYQGYYSARPKPFHK